MSSSSKIIRQFAQLLRSRVNNNMTTTGDVTAGSRISSLTRTVESSSASSSSSLQQHDLLPPLIIGGDFAGLSATFDPQDGGSLIPIPERLVPDELLQWGQVPKTLQVLVSETIQEDDHDVHQQQKMILRTTVTVLPAIGCSIDSLGTTLTDETIPLLSSFSSYWEDEEDDSNQIMAVQHGTNNDENLRMETIFGMKDEHRMRVIIDLIPGEESSSCLEISKPFVLSLEHKASTTSSSGKKLANGLDARTVSEMLGPELRKSKTFVDEYDDKVMDVLQDSVQQQQRNSIMKYLYVPGEVTIAYGWQQHQGVDNKNDEWVLEVSHVHKTFKRIVRRHFKILEEENKVDFRIDIRIEDINDE